MTLVGIELLISLENPVKSHEERTRTPFYMIVGKNVEIASFHIFDSRPEHKKKETSRGLFFLNRYAEAIPLRTGIRLTDALCHRPYRGRDA